MNPYINPIKQAGLFLYDQLGERGMRSNHYTLLRGAIRVYSKEIAAFTLLTPVLMDLIQFVYHHRQEVRTFPAQAKKLILHNFYPRPEETPETARKRICLNLMKVSGGLLFTTAVGITIFALIKLGILSTGTSFLIGSLKQTALFQLVQQKASLVGNRFFELEVPCIVYPGYTALLMAHAYQAKQHFQSGSKTQCAKHLFAACTAGATIGCMVTGIYDVRWHHMSYGLLCMLPRLSALNFFGSCMAIDSMLYWVRPMKDNFDFSNVFVHHLGSFALQLGTLTLFEIFMRYSKNRAKSPEQEQALKGILIL